MTYNMARHHFILRKIFRISPVLFLLFLFRLCTVITIEKEKQGGWNLNLRLFPKVEKQREISFDNPPKRFKKEDMVDENGDRFVIALWKFGIGVTGFAANPEECMDNIQCDIVFGNKIDISLAHAVVFTAGQFNQFTIPKKRLPHQLYVWRTLESAMHTPRPVGVLDSMFNLTMSYRTDADVYSPYGSMSLILRELKSKKEIYLETLLQRKRKNKYTAVWAVSNCYDKRMHFAKSLINAGLKVETFGRCFKNRQIGAGPNSHSFYEKIATYKFYLAFENSISCKDYFTEKFWYNGLRAGAVPIVWGPTRSDLEKVVPTKSFIHANDFSTPEKLVEYLNYLDKNETAYAEYLHWRTWVMHPERIEKHLLIQNRDNDLRSFCKLCSILQSDARERKLGRPKPTRIIKSANDAWWNPEVGKCII